jgi:hypothetical protein
MRTYTTEEFAAALTEGQHTAAGMLYTAVCGGKKTASVVLFKEAHHTSKDMQRSKREITIRSRFPLEIETKVPVRQAVRA